MKLLVGTDGSAAAMAAAVTATRIVTAGDRRMDLLSVADPFVPGAGSESREAWEARVVAESARILDQARTGIAPFAESVEVFAEIGSPGEVLAGHSEDYDLTVLGPRGAGSPEGEDLGPVAAYVVENSPGPVLIGRALQSDEGLRILVAVDGSGASSRAVETLSALVALSTAEVTLMHVVETDWIDPRLESELTTASEEDVEASESGVIEKEFVREGDLLIERARALLNPVPLAVNPLVIEGTPARELMDEIEAGPYDLVVVGATGSRDVKHRLLGSVSSTIARGANCSVLIVREPGETG